MLHFPVMRECGRALQSSNDLLVGPSNLHCPCTTYFSETDYDFNFVEISHYFQIRSICGMSFDMY